MYINIAKEFSKRINKNVDANWLVGSKIFFCENKIYSILPDYINKSQMK